MKVVISDGERTVTVSDRVESAGTLAAVAMDVWRDTEGVAAASARDVDVAGTQSEATYPEASYPEVSYPDFAAGGSTGHPVRVVNPPAGFQLAEFPRVDR